MVVLISGGAGFIGTHLATRLLQADNQVIIMDNLLEQVHGTDFPQIPEGAIFINGDVRNKKDWIKCLDIGCDTIVHLAAETGTGQSMDEIHRHTDVNIGGTAVMIEAINSTKQVDRVILASSRAVYGEVNKALETEAAYPVSIYGLTKKVQEDILKISCSIPYTILRLQNVYGPGQSLKNPYTGILSIFVEQMKNNQEVQIYDDGEPTRDFIYIQDVVDAFVTCLYNKITYNQIYNVGTSDEIKILDIAHKLKYILHSDSDIVTTKFHREGDVLYASGRIDKIVNHLDWIPNTSIDDGISQFIQWANNSV